MAEVEMPTLTVMTQNYAESAAYAAVRKFKAEIQNGKDPSDAEEEAINNAIGMIEASGSDYELAAEALEIEADIARHLAEAIREHEGEDEQE